MLNFPKLSTSFFSSSKWKLRKNYENVKPKRFLPYRNFIFQSIIWTKIVKLGIFCSLSLIECKLLEYQSIMFRKRSRYNWFFQWIRNIVRIWLLIMFITIVATKELDIRSCGEASSKTSTKGSPLRIYM